MRKTQWKFTTSSRRWRVDEEFMERFKVETGRMKGASECMKISGFMHGVNNPELTKCLNERVLKTLKEMMTTTTAFIRGETATASKKKVYTPWKPQDQSKRTPKEIFAAELEKFKPPPPMVTPADKRSSNKFYSKHRSIWDGYPPARQKKRGQAAKAIQAEVQKLVEAGLMREVYYYDWLSNPVMGYHHIQMAEMDEEKTAFYTPHGVYCYTKMRFGLKNAGATYQRLVDKAFEKQVGQNLEVYVDDLVIKSHTEAELLRDIEETFRTPGRHKTVPIEDRSCVATSIPTDNQGEAEQAFKQLKHHISELPMLVAPRPNEELIMYLSASQKAVGAVLMTERDSIQTPVYFVSRVLQGPELNYTPMEKLVLALVFAAKRLRSIMLREHNITYRLRTSVKGQNLADFLMEKPEEASVDMSEKEALQEPWTLFMDGSSCIDGSGAGLILTSPDGAEFTYALRFQFTASNNEAEYEALLVGLRIAAQMGVRNVQVSVDSKLVANQVLGTYIAKEENMIKYLEKVKTLVSGFASFSISQVPRSHNKKADALSKIASTSFAHLSKQVLVEVLQEKSIQEKEVAAVVEEEGPTWMTPITEYLKDGVLPDDKKEANKLRIKARQYELMDGILYRRSFLRPWLRCVGPLQADYVIREIHEGSCSMHAGPRSVFAKVMWSGYYWPTMHRDARDMILKCKDCQVHRPVPRNPQQPLTLITSPWPFYKWGIDIAGPFPEGPGKVKFLIVAMDYFTKWIEAKAVNEAVKRANISLGEGIKARLGEGNKKWIEEIPHVLWAHRTMIKSSNEDTLFSLTYGTEAVIPAEIKMPTYRTTVVDVVHNDDEIRLNLDLWEERRERAAIREAKAKSKMMRYYNARVRGVTFKPGDYVYRSNEASHAMDGGKLGPK
ncbi:reverse transcriptase domain-containing protein [Tanacetum coccineum]